VELGITSISANIDAVETVRDMVARTELQLLLREQEKKQFNVSILMGVAYHGNFTILGRTLDNGSNDINIYRILFGVIPPENVYNVG